MILVDVLIARNVITEELGEKALFSEIPEDSEKISGMDWVLEKISGLGRVSGTRWALNLTEGTPCRSVHCNAYLSVW